ncbi:MAG: MarR family transcriptional regulator [Gammaproteobacteria bacterium]|nr:MAG: MarR family transcriptional regulator [Gammaproteobacteria bacterium]RLA53568.1 MAG: MarR family transcriptional regulator [Gammaproteobacteria bacterium]
MVSPDNANAEIAHKFFFRLYQTMNLSLRKASEVLAEVGMSPQQWSILDSLSRPDLKEGMTVNGLVEYLMVSRQSLNGVLKRMEELDYIERVVNPDDLRSRKVRLTDNGRLVWEKAFEQTRRFYDESLKHMTNEDKVDGINTLEIIQANIKML